MAAKDLRDFPQYGFVGSKAPVKRVKVHRRCRRPLARGAGVADDDHLPVGTGEGIGDFDKVTNAAAREAQGKKLTTLHAYPAGLTRPSAASRGIEPRATALPSPAYPTWQALPRPR